MSETVTDAAGTSDVIELPDFDDPIAMMAIYGEGGSNFGLFWYTVDRLTSTNMYCCPISGKSLSNHKAVVLNFPDSVALAMHYEVWDEKRAGLIEIVRAKKASGAMPEDWRVTVHDGRVLFTERDVPRRPSAAKKQATELGYVVEPR
jgi:hypothetical protein